MGKCDRCGDKADSLAITNEGHFCEYCNTKYPWLHKVSKPIIIINSCSNCKYFDDSKTRYSDVYNCTKRDVTIYRKRPDGNICYRHTFLKNNKDD